MAGSWSEPGADPVADIRGFMSAWHDLTDHRPNDLVVSHRVYIRLQFGIARATMGKRAYRRWRGQFVAQMRRDARAALRERRAAR